MKRLNTSYQLVSIDAIIFMYRQNKGLCIHSPDKMEWKGQVTQFLM